MKINQIILPLEENVSGFDKTFKQTLVDVIVFFKANGLQKVAISNIIKELSRNGINGTVEQIEEELLNLGYDIVSDEVIIIPEEESEESNSESDTPEEQDDIKKMAMKQALK